VALHNLFKAHGDQVLAYLVPLLWRAAATNGAVLPGQVHSVFYIFLAVSTWPFARAWLWKEARGFPGALADTMQHLRGMSTEAASMAMCEFAGVIWNLALDDTTGRREALGVATLHKLWALLRDSGSRANPEETRRVCTAIFHLLRCQANARLLCNGSGTDEAPACQGIPLELLHKFGHNHNRHQLLQIVCAMFELEDEDARAYHQCIGAQVLSYFAGSGFFETLVDGDGGAQPLSATHPEKCPWLAPVAVSLLLRITSGSDSKTCCKRLMESGLIRQSCALLRSANHSAASAVARKVRADVIGIICNVAMESEDSIRNSLCDVALDLLLEIARAGHLEQPALDRLTRGRLLMALCLLSRTSGVALRSCWLAAISALCKLVRATEEYFDSGRRREEEEPLQHGLRLLAILLIAHGDCVAEPILPLLKRHGILVTSV